MKKYLAILLFIVIGLACKKDNSALRKAFEDITLIDIQNLETKFNSSAIVVYNTQNTEVLKPGAILLYKTNAGTLGKLKIVSTKYNVLTIDVVNFDINGNPSLQKNNLPISSNYECDLDMGVQVDETPEHDFWWDATQNYHPGRFIEPKDKAIMYMYSK